VDRPAPTHTATWLGGDIEESLAEIRVPAFVLDRAGVVRWTNARAVEVFGDLEGRHFAELVPADARPAARAEFAKQVLGKTRTSDLETVVLGRSGAEVPVQTHSAVLHDGRRVVGVFGIVHPETAIAVRRDVPGGRRLTPRQYEVLRLLARGASTQQIADELGLARETVRNHVRAVLTALRAHSRLEAVVEARRRGLVD
jgi:PAS domain S-box-containing protein